MLINDQNKMGAMMLKNIMDNQIMESKTIEYKERLSSNSSEEKIKILKAVTAFANTEGGDIYVGIREEKGKPVEIIGVDAQDIDNEILKLTQIISSNTDEPMNDFIIHPISGENGKIVLNINIKKSWRSPHRVKLNNKFYARNSNGTFELDVSELRRAFSYSEQVAEKINRFVAGRIIDISSKNTIVPINDGAAAILHLIPLSSFASDFKCNSAEITKIKNSTLFRSLTTNGVSHDYRMTLEGALSFSTTTESDKYNYTHFYRNGIIETVYVYTSNSVFGKQYDQKIVRLPEFKDIIRKNLSICLKLLNEFKFSLPLYLFVSLCGVKNYEAIINIPEFQQGRSDFAKFDRDIISLPHEVINSYQINIDLILKEIFSVILNACGQEAISVDS